MLPLTLDLSRLRLALVGAGSAALRRLERLDAAGANAVAVYAPSPSVALAALAGRRLSARTPSGDDLAGNHLVFIAGLGADDTAVIARQARAAGVIVHVEDTPEASDIQLPAVLHRGDLIVAVSTSGRSPGLAVEIKRMLGRIIGPEWAARLDAMEVARARWRKAGFAPAAVRQRTGNWLAAHGWLATGTALESHWIGGGANDRTGRRIRQG
ncbi:MAG: precorrin-2 dehydrogenase/sirohydrochlorin ferrochelatase family protein [Stellaceae bacterium]